MADDLLLKYGLTAPTARVTAADGEAPTDDLLAKYGMKSPTAAPKSALQTAKGVGMHTLEAAGHIGSLISGAAPVSDTASVIKLLQNELTGSKLPVANKSYIIEALRGLVTPGVPVSGYGDTLKELNVPSVKVGPIDSNEIIGGVTDMIVPTNAAAKAVSTGAKTLSKAGNRTYDNALRFVTREFDKFGDTSRKARYIEMLKNNEVGKGARNAKDVEKQIMAILDKKGTELDEFYQAADGAGKKIDIAPGVTQAEETIAQLQKLNPDEILPKYREMLKQQLKSGDPELQAKALEQLKKDAPAFESVFDAVKGDLKTRESGPAISALSDLIDTMKHGPRDLNEMREFIAAEHRIATSSKIPGGNQYQLGRRYDPKKTGAKGVAGAAADLVDTELSDALALSGSKSHGLPNEKVIQRQVGGNPADGILYHGQRAGNAGGTNSGFWTTDLQRALGHANKDGKGGKVLVARASDFPVGTFSDDIGQAIDPVEFLKNNGTVGTALPGEVKIRKTYDLSEPVRSSGAFRDARQDVATLLRAEPALRSEVHKAMAVAPNTAFDRGLQALTTMEMLMGNAGQGAKTLALLLGKQIGKEANSLAAGTRWGLGMMRGGQGIENAAQSLRKIKSNPISPAVSAWQKVQGNGRE